MLVTRVVRVLVTADEAVYAASLVVAIVVVVQLVKGAVVL